MKTLKRIATGLVADINFTGPISPFVNYADAVYENGIVIRSGALVLDLYEYPELVLDVYNTYVPQFEGDYGGIQLRRGNEVRELFEYYTEDMQQYSIVRLHKMAGSFQGSGLNSGQWVDKGSVSFREADSLAVTVKGSTHYNCQRLVAYRRPYVRIEGLLPGMIVEAGGKFSLATRDYAEVELDYPFSGEVKIWNDNQVVAIKNVTNAYGGDVFLMGLDVSIYTAEDYPITTEEERHLGNLSNGSIVADFKIVNDSAEEVTVVLDILDITPFKKWVTLALGDMDFKPSLTFTLAPAEVKPFSMQIQRPADSDYRGFDFKANECVFWLEVR